jgi:hypothetical protein
VYAVVVVGVNTNEDAGCHAPPFTLYEAASVVVAVSVEDSPTQTEVGEAVNAVIAGVVGSSPGQPVASVSAVMQPV